PADPRRPGLKPTAGIVQARAKLREYAVPTAERRLGVAAEVLEGLSAGARGQVLPVLGSIDPAQAGWGLLAAGTLLARNSQALVAPIGGAANDPSFTAGLAWGSLLTGVIGDDLIAISELATDTAEWELGARAAETRGLAKALAGGLLERFASPTSRTQLSADALTQISAALPDLDQLQAGWTVLAFGVWVGSNAEAVTAPLAARRRFGRRRVADPVRAGAGCSFSGALLAEIGNALIIRAAPSGGSSCRPR
ncbi:MAG: hypothetical protein M3Z06_15840, partial [Actinomycetota bacterium]|nr:hypothetical protein [Actinomycetota bacterium]